MIKKLIVILGFTLVVATAQANVDLTPCQEIGNNNPVCQGSKEDKVIFKSEKVPQKGHEIYTVFRNGMEIMFSDNKPPSILVVGPRYIGDGRYCYPVGNQWKCEEK